MSAAMANKTASTPQGQQPLPSVLPVLKVTTVQARSVDVIWTYGNRDPRYLFSGLSYQLSRAEAEALNFEPTTKYRFKLRIAFTSTLNSGAKDCWSKTYSEVEASTTDESVLVKVTAQLTRAVIEADSAKVGAILNEHGKQLSMETRDKNGKTLLMLACQSGSAEIVRMLLNAGASTSATTRSGKTALSIGVTYGSLRAAEALLQHDPELAKVCDVGGSTPLMWAAENASANLRYGVQMVELLLQYGVEVNQEDPRGQTAFDRLCATSGNVKAAQALILAGARIMHQVDKKHPMTSLMIAALNGHKDLVKELMEKCGADPTVQSEHGGTAKSFAETAGHRLIVNLIEERLHIINDSMAQNGQK
ncbi:ankyrin repeat-containing domain protein [Entophlyctis helioformis]|nr:ankyrin repeat-containing domain protein [Entophlyctis helioformis]